MSHVRTLIRHACVASILGQTAAGAHVFSNRAKPFFGMPLPAINILTTDEVSNPETVSDAPSLRELQLAIDIYASASPTMDDELDDLALEVENILAGNDALGDNAIHCELSQTSMDLSQLGEELAGVTRLIYTVTYLA